MFETVALNPPDAIFGLNELFKSDANPDKINLTVGVYKDESGTTPVLNCVHKAEEILLASGDTKSYLPIDGLGSYNAEVGKLVLGESLASSSHWAAAQTPGGTGALRVAGEMIRTALGADTIYMSDPTWANHPKIFGQAGLKVEKYGWLDDRGVALDFDRVVASLASAKAGAGILLHTVCHNPTGVDPTPEQWKQLIELVKEKQLIPIFDFAYQGFGTGLEEDAFPIRHHIESGGEAIVCSSFSKNLGLYSERVGAVMAIAASADARAAMLSQIKSTIRTMYSNPPRHGGAIAATVMSDADLRKTWIGELDVMRNRIIDLRQKFVATMTDLVPGHDFSYINDQSGMFSYSGINADQALKLREEHSIYILGSGRINIAGINSANNQRLCEAIASVIV